MTNPRILLPMLALLITPAHAERLDFDICYPGQRNTPTKTCIVDGDTLWLRGDNWRLADFDTPEPIAGNSKCPGGGTAREKELSGIATARLHELLRDNDWDLEDLGMDNSGRRGLARITINEGLARQWPRGDTFWCD